MRIWRFGLLGFGTSAIRQCRRVRLYDFDEPPASELMLRWLKDAQTQVRDERTRARTALHSAPIYWHGDNCKPRTLEALKRLVLRLTIQRASHEQGQPEAESDPEVDDVPEK